MNYRELGKTGIMVSQLCFGSLTIGPLQRNLSLSEGASLIRSALEAGVNFIDTAQLYQTYPYIAKACSGWRDPVVVATKSYAYTAKAMEDCLEEARLALNLDTIPIVLLHEQESEHTIRGHWPALDVLLKAKLCGHVRAVGISTHHVQGVLGACKYPEIEIISPLVNATGIGIQGGSRDDMLAAIAYAANLGKGLYAMKPLGGGHLIGHWKQSLDFLLAQAAICAVAIGMKSQDELRCNLAYFNGESISEPVNVDQRILHIESWCEACGSCVRACSTDALTMRDGLVVHSHAQCVFCGYCGAACPSFAIKVI